MQLTMTTFTEIGDWGKAAGHHYVQQMNLNMMCRTTFCFVLPHPPPITSLFFSSDEGIQNTRLDICMQFDHDKHGRDGSKGQTNKKNKGTHACVPWMQWMQRLCLCVRIVGCLLFLSSSVLFFASFSRLTLFSFFLLQSLHHPFHCVVVLFPSFLSIPHYHCRYHPLLLLLLSPTLFSSSLLFFS